MTKLATRLPLLLYLGAMITLPVHAADRWVLLSRHGECAEIGSLKRKIPDLGEVKDPHAFAALMQKKGLKVTLSEVPLSAGKAYEVTVPEKELFMVFALSEICDNAGMQ